MANSAKPTIGFLGAVTPAMWSGWVSAFEKRLKELGWSKGDNIEIDYKWAEGLEKNYAKFAKEFVSGHVDVIVTGGTQATLACKKAAAKSSIPVVFATAGDPLNNKLVPTFHRPGKVTGVSNQQTILVIKRLDLLRHLVGQGRIGVVGNDKSANVKLEMKIAQQVAPAFGLKVSKGFIRKPADIARVIKAMKGKVKALLVCTDPLITTHADALGEAAMQAKLPTMHAFREYLDHGGSLSYGPHFTNLFEMAAVQVNQILRGGPGEEMSNVPVSQPNNFHGAINLNAFKQMGIEVPPTLVELLDTVL